MKIPKRRIFIIIGVIFLAALAVSGYFIFQKNYYIEIIFPSSSDKSSSQGQKGIIVDSPKSGKEIFSPLEISGFVTGDDNWIGFEGQTGAVQLLDENNVKLGSAVLSATTDWTKGFPIYFKTNLEFSSGKKQNGKLVFNNENPSGMEEKNKEFVLPVLITQTSMADNSIKVNIYFNSYKLDPEISCDKVFPVERKIPKTTATARAAVEELLKGPTQKEISDGYSTAINKGVKIQKLAIENNVAKIDFDQQLEKSVAGSCKVSAIRAQITQTLKQFSTIKSVVISINGRTEDILQP